MVLKHTYTVVHAVVYENVNKSYHSAVCILGIKLYIGKYNDMSLNFVDTS